MDLSFSFSDLISGYVEKFNWELRSFVMRTSDGRPFDVKLTDNTAAELLRNLGEPYVDCTGQMADMLANGRFVFAYGIHYPESGKPFEAKHLVFVGRAETQFQFENQDWWIRQVRQLGDFYLKAQFPDNLIDYRNYRTGVNFIRDPHGRLPPGNRHHFPSRLWVRFGVHDDRG